ncbi:FecR domain-containing protein [Herbaspirillum lusitanum]|uniref:FecR domain-containing protein n=1 Tax=Herbaspirillum lusitanum TaxID=213312 RepID=A0ABW9AEB7_9BURK
MASAAVRADESDRSHAGILKVVRGDVQVQRKEQKLTAQVGDRLFAGDRVVTAADAAAGITLRDDTLMSLGPKSSFVLEGFAFNESSGDGNVAVRLAKGTLRYVSGLIGKQAPDRQMVNTPTATIGIRGTDFIVEVADE